VRFYKLLKGITLIWGMGSSNIFFLICVCGHKPSSIKKKRGMLTNLKAGRFYIILHKVC
jgi:hypothetical protein